MIAEEILRHQDNIRSLCEHYDIDTLWVFGSATTDQWDPASSDVDFLVDVGDYDPTVMKRYVGLADGLEALLQRPVDLVSVGGLRRRHRLRGEIERSRIKIYERGHSQAIA